jgi:hypothetical protein
VPDRAAAPDAFFRACVDQRKKSHWDRRGFKATECVSLAEIRTAAKETDLVSHVNLVLQTSVRLASRVVARPERSETVKDPSATEWRLTEALSTHKEHIQNRLPLLQAEATSRDRISVVGLTDGEWIRYLTLAQACLSARRNRGRAGQLHALSGQE